MDNPSIVLSSSRPYLIRAMHEWLTDNRLTPHVIVNALHESAAVPQEYVQDGQIVLNVDYDAVSHLELGNEWISFSARFGGVPIEIDFPPEAVMGIYARENGQGMMFPDEEYAEAENAEKLARKPELKEAKSGKKTDGKTQSRTGKTTQRKKEGKPKTDGRRTERPSHLKLVE